MVHKPIRLVPFQYYAKFDLLSHEYEFEDYHNFSSIKHLRTGAYTFEISLQLPLQISRVWYDTPVKLMISKCFNTLPFIQADRFEIALALLEQRSVIWRRYTTSEIANFIAWSLSQLLSQVLVIILDFFDRTKRGRACLTPLTKQLLLGLQLVYAGLILEHDFPSLVS